MDQIALWGNRCDLSRPVKNKYVDNSLTVLEELDTHILINDSEDVWNTLNVTESDATVGKYTINYIKPTMWKGKY